MKFKDQIKLIKTDRASLRSFAWIVGGIFLTLGLLSGHKHGQWINLFSCLGTTLLFMGVIAPMFLKPVYLAWMTLGFAMGVVVAPIMFAILFFIAVSPISMIARACGKKFLDLQFRTSNETYWITKTKKEDFRKRAENQF